ncbi:Zona pellucida-like domain-containing protein 1 [Channa argus]|uniref:Zona pellucida-like domain-containing protein 1 n=1 Tax=Channa argus TaxID=215402 RepID=A0A6G1PR07_CHAAH|nr:Zona pellucida-like domain-containing protein 1 [Channa argus]
MWEPTARYTMKTNRCTLRTLRLIILGCQLGLILRTEAQAPDYCVTSETNRPPDNTDINVLCGSEAIDLNIYLCPVYQALYNESLLVLNNQLKPGCFGTADWTAIPPVVKFRIPLNETLISACGNNFKDSLYQELLTIPTTGLNLKTKIYVAVKATNLTSRFNVLLDRCYATTSPQPSATSYYDLFVGCVRDPQTKVETNGVTQKAQFSFEAFRFLEHKNLTVSTFYVHCVTRLCEVSSCSTFLPNCGTQKVKRESPDVPANATISSPIIIVSSKGNGAETSTPNALVAMKSYSSAVVAAIICVVILAIFIITMAVYFVLYVRRRKGLIQ